MTGTDINRMSECKMSPEPVEPKTAIIRAHREIQETKKTDLTLFLSGIQIVSIMSKFKQITAKYPKRLINEVKVVTCITPDNPKMLSSRSYEIKTKDKPKINGKSERYRFDACSHLRSRITTMRIFIPSRIRYSEMVVQ